jgi:hypothetical protein
MTDTEAKAILAAIPANEVPAPMDPNATLDRIRVLTRQYDHLTDEQVNDLTTLVIQLDTYLTGGGNMPRAWRPFLCDWHSES